MFKSICKEENVILIIGIILSIILIGTSSYFVFTNDFSIGNDYILAIFLFIIGIFFIAGCSYHLYCLQINSQH